MSEDHPRRSDPDVDTLKRGTVQSKQIAEEARLARELSRYGSPQSVPWLMISHSALYALTLDDRATKVLAEVDGTRTIVAIIAASGLSSSDCVTTILDLLQRKVIALR
jgi:hypothetical protein